MGPFTARAIYWLIFGFFVVGIAKEFKFFDSSLMPYIVIVSTLMFFLFQEIMLKKLEFKRTCSTDNESTGSMIFYVSYGILWLFAICLLISLSILWWVVVTMR